MLAQKKRHEEEQAAKMEGKYFKSLALKFTNL